MSNDEPSESAHHYALEPSNRVAAEEGGGGGEGGEQQRRRLQSAIRMGRDGELNNMERFLEKTKLYLVFGRDR